MNPCSSRALLCALWLASVTACDVPLVEGAYVCTLDEGCPQGWVCGADRLCYRECTGACLGDAGLDAGPPIDAGLDAGPRIDAGADAGTDAGADAGPEIERNCACPGEPAHECEAFTWALELHAESDAFNSEFNAIELDDDGFILAAGGTQGNTTLAGSVALQGHTEFLSGGFVTRISPDGREVCWNLHLPAPQTNVFTRVLALARHGGVVYFLARLESSGTVVPLATAAGMVQLTAPASVVGAVDVSTGQPLWLRELNLEDSGGPERALTDIAANAQAVYLVGTFDEATTLSDHAGANISHTPDGKDGAIVRLRSSDGGVDWFDAFGGSANSQVEGVAVSGNRLAVLGELQQNDPHVRLYANPTDEAPGEVWTRDFESLNGVALDGVFSGDRLVVLGTAAGFVDFAPGECVDFQPGGTQTPFVISVDSSSSELASLPSDSGAAFRLTTNAQSIAAGLSLGPSRDGNPTVVFGGRINDDNVSAVPQPNIGQVWFASVGLSPSSRERPRWMATYPNTNPAILTSTAADDDRVLGGGAFTVSFTLEPGHTLTRAAASHRGALLFSSAGDRPRLASDVADDDGWRQTAPCDK